MATPLIKSSFSMPQTLLAFGNTATLATPRVGIGLSLLTGYGVKKAINAWEHFDEVTEEGPHSWEEVTTAVKHTGTELVSALGFSVLGTVSGRVLGTLLAPALAVALGPEIALVAGAALGTGLGFFGLKEVMRYLSDAEKYEFLSGETARNLLSSSVYMIANPAIFKGATAAFSAIKDLTHFQRIFFSGVISNTAASAIGYGLETLLSNEPMPSFRQAWARDLRASAMYSAVSPVAAVLGSHKPNLTPKGALTLPETLPVRKGKEGVTRALAQSLIPQAHSVVNTGGEIRMTMKDFSQKTFRVVEGPTASNGKPSYYYLLETSAGDSSGLLRRTAALSMASRLTGNQSVISDVIWKVDTTNLPASPNAAALHAAITEMKVWSPYRQDYFTVGRGGDPTGEEISFFMRGISPSLLEQAGGVDKVHSILTGKEPISLVSQYQIRLCFDNFRHAFKETDAVAIYGSGLRRPEHDRLKTKDELDMVTGDKLIDFIGIGPKVPEAMWQMGQRYNQAVVADPSRLIDRGKIVPRSWAQLAALSDAPYVYVNPDPVQPYDFKISGSERYSTLGRAKIGLADAPSLDRPGGRSPIPVSDRFSKLDLARRDEQGVLQPGHSLVWVHPERQPAVLAQLKGYSDKVYDAYLRETVMSEVRPGTTPTLETLMNAYVTLSYKHEAVRAAFELKPEKRRDLLEGNFRTLVPHFTDALNRSLVRGDLALSRGGRQVKSVTVQDVTDHRQAFTVQSGHSVSDWVKINWKQYEANGEVATYYLRWWAGGNAVASETTPRARLERKALKTTNPLKRAGLQHAVIPVVSGFANSLRGMQLNSLLPGQPDLFTQTFPIRPLSGLYLDG